VGRYVIYKNTWTPLHILRRNPNLTGAVGFDRGGWTNLSRWLRSGGRGLLQAKGATVVWTTGGGGAVQAAVGSSSGSPATPTGPPATKIQGKNYQIEKEATRISPEGSGRRGRRRRRRSRRGQDSGGGTPVVVRWKSGEAPGSSVKWRGGSGRLI
jgi:hypothetical protein